jgi:hypothetical protein
MTYMFIALFIVSVFVFDGVKRLWRQNEWKRRWKDAP